MPDFFAFSLRLLLFGFLMGKAFGFLVWEAFGREKIIEGKRIAKGELLVSLRAKTLRKLKRTWDSASLHRELYT
jgi:hypothetical protein